MKGNPKISLCEAPKHSVANCASWLSLDRITDQSASPSKTLTGIVLTTLSHDEGDEIFAALSANFDVDNDGDDDDDASS